MSYPKQIVLDPGLAMYAGVEAWQGIAWDEALTAEHEAQIKDHLKQSIIQATDRYTRNLPTRYTRYSLDNLNVHEGNRAAVEAGRSLRVGENLYIHGTAGNGKTHLAVAVGLRFAEEGKSVQFYGVGDLFARIRARFSDDAPPLPDLYEPDVLILDDLGKVKPTDFVYQEFYRLVEGRWADELTTIFTANHRASDVSRNMSPDAEGAAAILSRMASGVVVEVKGPDERLARRKA